MKFSFVAAASVLTFVTFVVGCDDKGAKDAKPAAEEAPAAVADATNTAVVTPPAGATELIIPVEGMTCEACEKTIMEALKKTEGVVSCTASHTDKNAKVVFDPKTVSAEALVATINGLGYKASAAPQ